MRGLLTTEKPKPLTPSLSRWEREQAEQASGVAIIRNSRSEPLGQRAPVPGVVGASRELGEPPLPGGERVGVRGLRTNEKPKPLTPPHSRWEREHAEQASGLAIISSSRSEQLEERAPVAGVDVAAGDWARSLSPQGRGVGCGGCGPTRSPNPSPHPTPDGRGSTPSKPRAWRSSAAHDQNSSKSERRWPVSSGRAANSARSLSPQGRGLG